MAKRMSTPAHSVYVARRMQDRERTNCRRAERAAKRGARVAFGGAL